MGALPCHRNGCGNIMCDVYVYGVGYICNECVDDFRYTLKEMGIKYGDDDSWKQLLLEFIEMPKTDNLREIDLMEGLDAETFDQFIDKHRK